MILKNTIFSILYFLTGLLFLLFENGTSFVPAFILKALMIPSLIIIFLLNIRPLLNRFHLMMLATAINRKNKVDSTSYLFILAGAIFFVLSDSAIAINKFGHSFNGSSIVVMTTYLAAQYLIVTGYIKQWRIMD